MSFRPATIAVICCDQALELAVATQSHWIHPLERARCERMRSRTRREQWLAGRWWLKRQLLTHWNLGVAPSEIHIVSHDARNMGTAPQAYVDDTPLPMALSLSHSDHYVAAAIASGETGSCGIDLVDAKLTNLTALKAWIAEDDVRATHANDSDSLTAVWAAKEAAFKTLAGEPFRPGCIQIRPSQSTSWRWSYPSTDSVITGDVELRKHSQFVLAIAHRHVPC